MEENNSIEAVEAVEKKSVKAELIKVVIENLLSNIVFESFPDLKKLIEQELDNYLKFKVEITNIKFVQTGASGTIIFEDEFLKPRVITFDVHQSCSFEE